ncbi:MAG: hypothetical protein ACI4RD_00980 [Kiritimatiellia bacterium]
MKKSILSIASVCCLLPAWAGETQRGDITAAVRASGGTVAVTAPGITPENMVNSLYNDRYLSVANDFSPLTIEFDFGSEFVAGEDIVVTGLTFMVGGNTPTSYWGNYADRMPKSWVLSGSNDGAAWTEISCVSGFADYAEGKIGEQQVYSGAVAFANWRSFRRYRLYVTASTGNATYMIQLSDVAFSGLYGGTVVQPEPVEVEITAQVRAAGKQSFASNMDAWVGSPADLFDGIFGCNNNRFLSVEGMPTADAPWTIDYLIDAGFARGADVIVTRYAIDVDKQFNDALLRMPRSWRLQGSNDGTVWQTLDAIDGFTDWQEEPVANETDGALHPHYRYVFAIANSVAYRQYRLSVSELNGAKYLQLTEIQLFGYVDAELAGRVGLTTEGNDIDVTANGAKGSFTPEISVSKYDETEGVYSGSVAELFDQNWLGDYPSSFLARMGKDGDERAYAPLRIGYAIPTSYLPGQEIVLKRYSLISRTDRFGQYVQRMPKSWSLEGQGADGRWIRIDRREEFDGWQTDEENKLYCADFDLAGNRLAFRNYRLRIYEATGTSSYGERTQMQQILLFEIRLAGKWGHGISEPPPPAPGFSMRVR